MNDEYIFTFGYGHNPGIGYYCIIPAESESVARHIMDSHYNSKWAFCYTSKDAAGVSKYGLKQVIPGFKFEP